MLTLLKDIERFNKRYNKRRGSAMLMVVMTMAIIMVVGTSMLFVTLSSFSTSLADTQATKAYNAVQAVAEQIKDGDTAHNIIEAYTDDLKKKGDVAKVQFVDTLESLKYKTKYNDYILVNGVKVYVTITMNSTNLDEVIFDIIGEKGGQTSKLSFYSTCEVTSSSTSIEDTFGDSLVMNADLGSETTDPSAIFRRIEGDVAINCFTTENGVRTMTTRIFNPIVLEGVTGSIYANGDLIIGATDNMIRVQGNIYCDGNLTIRGLDLGCNLPALRKSYYQDKYLHYSTYALKTFLGSIQIPGKSYLVDGFSANEYVEQDGNTYTAGVGDSMYEPDGNGGYRIINCYDILSHYTLQDYADKDYTDKKTTTTETYTFWTKEYKQNSDGDWTADYDWKEITIKLNEDPEDVWNSQYLGASMYYVDLDTYPNVYVDGNGVVQNYPKTDGAGKPILQYAEGGSIYCSGDIIFDTVNYGNVYTYEAGIFETSSTSSEQETGITSALRELGTFATLLGFGDLVKELEGELQDPKSDYLSLSCYAYGRKDGLMPIQTIIHGDVYCQGRMVFAPDITRSYTNYKGVTKITLANFYNENSSTSYFKNADYKASNVYNTSSTFRNIINTLWKAASGVNLGTSVDLGTTNLTTANGVALSMFTIKDNTGSGISADSSKISSFITAYKAAYNSQKSETSGASYQLIQNLFKTATDGKQSAIVGYEYSVTGSNIADYKFVTFGANSDLYIQNNSLRKKNDNTEKYADVANDPNRVVLTTDRSDQTELSSIRDVVANSDGSISSKYTGTNSIYTAALTLRYTQITVHNVYANGEISLLGSSVNGYASPAKLTVTNELYDTSEALSEFTTYTIKEMLKLYNVSDEKIVNDYIDADNMKGSVALTFENADNYSYTEVEEHLLTSDKKYQHTMKVVVLAAYYQYNKPMKWTRSASWKSWGKAVSSGTPTESFNIGLGYIISDSSNGGTDYTGYFINASGEPFTMSMDDLKSTNETIYNTVVYLKDHGNTMNVNSTAFIYYRTDDAFKNVAKNSIVVDTNPPSGADKNVWSTEATYTYSGYSWMAIKTLDAVISDYGLTASNMSSIASIDISLAHDESTNSSTILNSNLLNTDCVLTLLSNTDKECNSGYGYGGVYKDGLAISSASISGTKPKSETYESLVIKAWSAFSADDLYGMYLTRDETSKKLNQTVFPDKEAATIICTIQNVFDEITSETFAVVVEAEEEPTVKTEENDGVLKKLKELQDAGNIVEYNKLETTTGDGCKTYVSVDREATDAASNTSGKTIYTTSLKRVRIQTTGINLKKDIAYATVPSSALCTKQVRLELEDLFLIGDYYCNLTTMYFEYSDEPEDSKRLELMTFTNSEDATKKLVADNTFATDPLYSGKIDISSIFNSGEGDFRSEVQYTINQNTYFNFENTASDITFQSSPTASLSTAVSSLLDNKRTNFLIDTSKSDIYIFFNSNQTKDSDGNNLYQFIFKKCTFQVTGEHNVYIMLVGDTGFEAQAYTYDLSINITADTSDDKVGTHFESGTYWKYKPIFRDPTEQLLITNDDVAVDSFISLITSDKGGALNIAKDFALMAEKDGDVTLVGEMFIIGTGSNVVTFGRGGSVNALVYIPNGTYKNELNSVWGIVPIANSSNNEASIVAKDIFISGSNRGQLIFQTYDVSKIAGGNKSSAANVFDDLLGDNTSGKTYKWVVGDYIYD